MDIAAAANTHINSLSSLGTDTGVQLPDVRDVEAFKKMIMNAQPIPEASVVDAVQTQQAMFADVMKGVSPIASDKGIDNPGTNSADTMLHTQYELFNLSFKLDLTAKVAGQFSQAINKLTTLQ